MMNSQSTFKMSDLMPPDSITILKKEKRVGQHVTADNSNGRVMMVAYKYFYDHPRLQRETHALIRRGFSVDVICPRRPFQKKAEAPLGATFHSMPIARKRASRYRYMFEHIMFMMYAFVISTFLYLRYRHKMIQVFVMPEILMLSCVGAKLFGAKVLMDWIDPSREVFLTKYEGKPTYAYLFLIDVLEKCAVSLATVIITPNAGFRNAFIKRGHNPNKIKIVINSPDPNLFGSKTVPSDMSPKDESRRFIVLHHGTILRRHGIHTVIEAMAIVVKKHCNIHFDILGDGDKEYTQQCVDLVQKHSLERNVNFMGRVNIHEIPNRIQAANVGVIPNERNVFTEINFPQRIMEYGLLKVPVIISRLPGVEDYVTDSDVCFMDPNDHRMLAEKIIILYENPAIQTRLADHLFETCQHLGWEKPYREVVDTLVCAS